MSMPNCPFCGVVTDVPHETQAGCIAALNEEITRMRALLDEIRKGEPQPSPERDEGEDAAVSS